jgi:hypothetical protein
MHNFFAEVLYFFKKPLSPLFFILKKIKRRIAGKYDDF